MYSPAFMDLRILIYLMLQVCGYHTTVSTTCNSRLLSDRIRVPDSAFEHSTAANVQHGASAARDDPSDVGLQERAWCPEYHVHNDLREFLQIDLGRQVVIKMIITKGRVAQSKGRQTTPYFYVKYRREYDANTGAWLEYRKENGTKRFNGNSDAMTENYNAMEPPFVARFIRIYPFSVEPEKTCLKVELLGCDANGIVEYRILQGTPTVDSVYPPFPSELHTHALRFLDQTYDSLDPPAQQTKFELFSGTAEMLRGGLGKLTDNDTESDVALSPFSSLKYVGWKRPLYYSRLRRRSALRLRSSQSPGSQQYSVQLVFRFDSMYNFTGIHLFLSNDFHNGISLPGNISIQLSAEDPSTDETSPLIFVAPDADATDASSRWFNIHLTPRCPADMSEYRNATQKDLVCSMSNVGRYVVIKLFFNTDWIALGEVNFANHKVNSSVLSSLLEKPPRAPVPSRVPERKDAAVLFHADLPDGTPTTLTLSIICGILATLICIGLVCMLFAWRRKYLRHGSPRRRKHANGSIPFSDPTQSAGQTFNSQFTKLSNQKGVNGGLIDQRLIEVQTQFQHPKHCQQQMNLGQNQAYLTNGQLYSDELGSRFNLISQNAGFSYHPNTPNVQTSVEQTSFTVKRSSPELVQFLPMATTQSLQISGFPNIVSCANDSYRKLNHEAAIYTSLPGSDCDSQPYARVSNGVSGGILIGLEDIYLPSTHYLDRAPGLHAAGARTTLLPPPPSLPLPPIPSQHISPNRQSPNSLNDDQADSGVSVANHSLLHHPPNPMWLTANRLIAEQMMNGHAPHLYNIQSSDYSSITMGSSGNAYGAYYGAPLAIPPESVRSYPLHIRR